MDLNEMKQETENEAERKKFGTNTSKESILKYLNKECDLVLDGEIKGYELFFFLNKLEKIIKDIKDQIKPTVLDEVKDKFEWNGFELSVKKGSGRYDFSMNKEWKNYKDKMKGIEDNMKIAYKKNMEYIDSETGEIFEIPIFKSYSDSINFKKI